MNNTHNPAIRVNIVVPMILFLMIFSLVIDNSFKIISPDLVEYFGVSASTVSWQVTLSGLVIGIGAIVYAAMSDSICIRNLLITGIVFICAGSLFGYMVHDNYWLIVVARVIQAAGLGATETLYMITVAKYLNPKEQKKYMGFSTSSFQIATVIGTLTGGFIATYLEWQHLFLIPLLTILLIPFLWKYLPQDGSGKNSVDIIGMLLVAAISTALLLCISEFSWLLFGGFVLVTVLFFLYISNYKKAFISIDFFKNKVYVLTLAMVFIMYTTQAAYALSTFSFLLTDIYKVQLDVVSLMFIPASLGAALVGALSGKIAKHFSSKQCIYTAITLIVLSVWSSILFIGNPIVCFAGALIVFSASYALMYAPLVDTSLKKVPVENAGTALGFYNLCINVAMSVGFTYSAFLIDKQDFALAVKSTATESHYAGVLLAIGAITACSLLIYHFGVLRFLKK